MQNFYKLFLILCLVSTFFALSACGKVASPEPYDHTYPHAYPQD